MAWGAASIQRYHKSISENGKAGRETGNPMNLPLKARAVRFIRRGLCLVLGAALGFLFCSLGYGAGALIVVSLFAFHVEGLTAALGWFAGAAFKLALSVL